MFQLPCWQARKTKSKLVHPDATLAVQRIVSEHHAVFTFLLSVVLQYMKEWMFQYISRGSNFRSNIFIVSVILRDIVLITELYNKGLEGTFRCEVVRHSAPSQAQLPAVSESV